MTHVDLRYLDPVLAPRHAVLVEDLSERGRLVEATERARDEDYICGYISRVGRVLATRLPTGGSVIYQGEIKLDDDLSWEPAGEPTVYRLGADDTNEAVSDARRLFLTHSLRTGGAQLFAGWRSRIVALIPEEVGPKEAKIFRTLADGSIEVTHTYNVLDAFGTYACWLNDLAMEFGGTDAAIERSGPAASNPEWQAVTEVRSMVQAWLMREAADAELTQARYTLGLALGAHAHLLKLSDGTRRDNDAPHLSIAELARSLYTDRPNLNRIVKAAERDGRLARLLAIAERQS